MKNVLLLLLLLTYYCHSQQKQS